MKTEEEIHQAAIKYADQMNDCWSNDYAGFTEGAKFANASQQWVSVEERLNENIKDCEIEVEAFKREGFVLSEHCSSAMMAAYKNVLKWIKPTPPKH